MTDVAQFESFVQHYQDMVYSTAWRLLGNDSDSQDVAQQVFLRAWEHRNDVVQSTTAGGWLKTVTRNLAINHLQRYRARWRFFSEFTNDDETDAAEQALPLSVESSSDATLLRTDQRRLIDEAMAKLPADQRAALVLYHFEDMDYSEIATQLGVSLGKVKTDIHRARLLLRNKLKLMQDELGVSF